MVPYIGFLAFKMSQIEAKSINFWLRYDPNWNISSNWCIFELIFQFWSYLNLKLMDFASIWLILKAKKPLYGTMVLTTVRILEPVTIWEPRDRSGPWPLQTLKRLPFSDKAVFWCAHQKNVHQNHCLILEIMLLVDEALALTITCSTMQYGMAQLYTFKYIHTHDQILWYKGMN